MISLLLSAFAFAQVPEDFISIAEVSPSVQVEMRYFSEYNFVGRVINGYKSNKCYLTKAAANALAKAQEDLAEQGYTLKVYDCYRPQKAVDDFEKWAGQAGDTKMKENFYPELPKEKLFALGYIAHQSGHSRGSTVDLGLAPLKGEGEKGGDAASCVAKDRKLDEPIDMGTNFDCFSDLSHPGNKKVGAKAQKNRQILSEAMRRAGFKPYDQEWWHFKLANEPFPKTYFDFDVE